MPLIDLRTRPLILAQSAVAVPLTGTASETALATIAIPAGTIGPNGSLRITTLWSHTNSANNKTWRIRLGGIGGTAFAAVVRSTTATDHDIRIIRNRGSASSQVALTAGTGVGFGTSGSAPVTGSVDTASAQDLVLSGQLANTGETITLEAYTVELLRVG